MLVKTIRKPGAPGTRRLVARYGDRLICVRYRYDPLRGKRYKTVELIVEEAPWVPPPEPEVDAVRQAPRRLGVRVAYHERELRLKIKQAGGTWSEQERLWRVAPDVVEALGLQTRVVRR